MKYCCTFMILFLIFSSCERELPLRLTDNPYVQFESLRTEQDVELKFMVVLPEQFSAKKEYPILIAFPPGDQTQELMEGALEFYWMPASIRNGWIVVGLYSPDGTLFYREAAQYIPALFDWLRAQYHVENNKFHLGGNSNGGLSAFRIALDYSNDVSSLTVFPGYPPTGADFKILDKLKYIPVNMFVGEHDTGFLNQMRSTYNTLQEVGAKWSHFEVHSGQGHVIENLSSDELFEYLNKARP